MPTRRLTATAVDHLRTDKPQEDFFDELLPGFLIRVTSGGTKTYQVMTRELVAGAWKKRRKKIARVGDSDPASGEPITLATARERARALIVAATDGQRLDEVLPQTPREEMVERSENCFANVRGDFLRLYRGKKNRRPAPNTLDEYRRCLSGDRFQAWEHRALADITEDDVGSLLDGVVTDGFEARANKIYTVLRLLFKWARLRKIIDASPAEYLSRPGAEESRERVLGDDELVRIWNSAGDTNFGRIVRLLILTGQRRGEVAGMCWSELDIAQRLWKLPADRTKNGRPHLVPLSSAAMSILGEQREELAMLGLTTDLVFTTNGKNTYSGWSRSKDRLDHRCKVDGWCLHDARRTLVTGMNELQFEPHVVEAVVNHVSGKAKAGVAGVYNRALYLPERTRALQRWSRHVLRLVARARP